MYPGRRDLRKSAQKMAEHVREGKQQGSVKARRAIYHSGRSSYASLRGLTALFHVAMCDDATGPSRGRGRSSKYTTAVEATELEI